MIKHRVMDYKEALDEKCQEINKLNVDLELKNQEIRYLRDRNLKMLAEDRENLEKIETLEKTVKECEERIARQSKTIDTYMRENKDLSRSVKEKEDEIERFKNEIERFKRDFNKVVSDNIKLRETIIDIKNTALSELKETIVEKNKEIEKLKLRLNQVYGKIDMNAVTDIAKVDYSKIKDPICKSVPCSAAIGKLENVIYKNKDNNELKLRLSDDALSKLEDNLYSESDFVIAPVDKFIGEINDDIRKSEYETYCKCDGLTTIRLTAQHMWNKFNALCNAGFTPEQAMSLIPMWTDEADQ